ncbi:MBL fold metallo-hydrolase [Shewanella surugensis]|uniref:MBL fold metallo-hydrolase n=1 Tax=Shewanella surugensis TaxID=212020 RepID=A0ABT0L6W0_9GAMM|nr:MBL fold metallo-hydrolase [Shewanella surugensis]MCL1123434.1 MBL fold metallo-hydrolase [Shewanella surugensis]
MLTLLKVGHCFHPEAMVMRGHSWKSMQFPAYVGLIKHPKLGYILFDTGYAKRFIKATHPFPERLYRCLTPMHLCDKEQLITQLHARGIRPEEIRYIFISHFHADHIAGLMDFPAALFICSRIALNAISQSSRFKGLIKGYLPQLLPSNFTLRCRFIEDCQSIHLSDQYAPFHLGYDIFADGSAMAISLPGHAAGHFGLLLENQQKTAFLIGDACWTQEAYTQGARPNRLANIIMDNGDAYLETLNQLSKLYSINKSIQLIPSHCQKTIEGLMI